MPDYVADTHSLIWYLQDSPRLGPKADAAFDACDRGECVIFVPTVCLVELIYLQEKGRIPDGLKSRFDALLNSGMVGLVPANLTPDVVNAVEGIPRELVPDMPDRIIAATAKALGLGLLSRDRAIMQAGIEVIW